MSLFNELKRRKVFRVGIGYVVGAWVLIQVADILLDNIGSPPWVIQTLFVALTIGFFIALFLSWAYEITPEGVRRDGAVVPATAVEASAEQEVAEKSAASVSTPVVSEADAKSIAVLPFADMSPDKDQDYFCEGMAEEIINALTKISGVYVASRTASFQFKGENIDISLIGERLNVRTVLEGSVRKAMDQLRVTAQLIKVEDGYHIWSEGYDRELKDVFVIQKEIAENIVQAFQLSLSPVEEKAMEQRPTTDFEAYDIYLRGRKYFYLYHKRGFNYARELFSRAIELDSDYALAYAGLADCFSCIYMYYDSSVSNRLQAETASRLALQLDPKLAQAHASRALALSLSKRYEEAEQAFESAIRLDPKLFEAYYFYARDSLTQGKLEKAATSFEAACRVRPEDYQSPALLAQVYTGLGRKEEAVKAERNALDLIEHRLERNPDDVRALYLGAIILVKQEKMEQGLEWVKRALAIEPDEPMVMYNVACVYTHANELDLALDSLEKSYLGGMINTEWMENDSDLDPLRNLPRFKALLDNKQ